MQPRGASGANQAALPAGARREAQPCSPGTANPSVPVPPPSAEQVWRKAVDCEAFSPQAASPSMRARLSGGDLQAPLLLYVGRVSHEKNIVFLRASCGPASHMHASRRLTHPLSLLPPGPDGASPHSPHVSVFFPLATLDRACWLGCLAPDWRWWATAPPWPTSSASWQARPPPSWACCVERSWRRPTPRPTCLSCPARARPWVRNRLLRLDPYASCH